MTLTFDELDGDLEEFKAELEGELEESDAELGGGKRSYSMAHLPALKRVKSGL